MVKLFYYDMNVVILTASVTVLVEQQATLCIISGILNVCMKIM